MAVRTILEQKLGTNEYIIKKYKHLCRVIFSVEHTS